MENVDAVSEIKKPPLIESDFPADTINQYFPKTSGRDYWVKNGGYWRRRYSNPPPVNVTVGAGSVIGEDVCFSTTGKIDIGAGCVIGDSCSVSSPLTIGQGTVMEESTNLGKNVTIGQNVTIGRYSSVAGSVFIGDNVVVPSGLVISENIPSISLVIPRTQKARGIKALKNRGFETPNFSLVAVEDAAKETSSLIGKFVRPCPVSPRHGFVDSRPVANETEALDLIAQTMKADPKAEILSMPFINALYSGIWTTGSLTIGPGNDGATAGHESIRIPVQGRPHTRQWTSLLSAAGITEQPYMELLWEEGGNGTDNFGRKEKRPFKTIYVQLRNGPALPASVDFVPKSTKVKRIIIATGDLLEWETKIKSLTPGTVVYHPGGSLASHYAVHAVLNKVPVLVSRKPKVGEVLEPCSETQEPNLEEVRAGFVLGCRLESSYAAACRIMLAGCHSTSVWLGRYDALLGLAMGCAYRLIITAGLGESRHTNGGIGHEGKTREQVYKMAWNRSLHKSYREKYVKVLYLFKNRTWRGGYGGESWFNLCQWAGKMHNSLLEGNVKQALENLNGAVHAVHNGGWAFNKFITEKELNVAAVNPVVPLLDVAPMMYRFAADKSTMRHAPKWWTNRSKIPIDGESETEKEEPQTLEKGTETCSCDKPNCLNCYPDGSCECSLHDCIACYPNGCECVYKACHDCRKCPLCLKPLVDAYAAKYKAEHPDSYKLGVVNHMAYKKSCYACSNEAYIKFRSGVLVARCCLKCSPQWIASVYPVVLMSDDPDSDYEGVIAAKTVAKAVAKPVEKLAITSVKESVLESYLEFKDLTLSNYLNVASTPLAFSYDKPAPVTMYSKVYAAQAKLLNPTTLHIQYKYKGKEHQSYDVKIPDGAVSAVKEVFNAAASSDNLVKSWATALLVYLPMEEGTGGWWRIGSLLIKVPDTEAKTKET